MPRTGRGRRSLPGGGRAPRGIAIALLAIVAGCAHAVSATLTLGPKRELLVAGKVNGRPAIFQLDTGASTTSFTRAGPRRFRLRAGWPGAGHEAGGDLADVTWAQVVKLEFANPRTGLELDDDEITISAAIGADRQRLTFRTSSDVAIELGPLALHTRSVWINELPIFRTFGLADRPAVVLGTDVLAGRRVVVDPFTRRVYLSR